MTNSFKFISGKPYIRQGDERSQDVVLDAVQLLATSLKKSTNCKTQAERGLQFIFNLTSEFITPPFKPALWPTIKIFAAWSKSGVDALGKCLPSLLPALNHPATAGEALDAIVSLANAAQSEEENESLEKCLLDSILNGQVPLQTKLISISAVAACAKAKLLSQHSLRTIGLEIFKISVLVSHCLLFLPSS